MCICMLKGLAESLVVGGVLREANDGHVPGVDEAAVNTSRHLQLTLHPDAARGDSLARRVGCLAHIRAGIFRIGVENVQSYEAEVVSCAEAMACRKKNKPFFFFFVN